MKRIGLALLAVFILAAPVASQEVPVWGTRPNWMVLIDTKQQAVTATATALTSIPGARVVCMNVKTGGSQTVYFGKDANVTTSTGKELKTTDSICRPASDPAIFFVIAASTGSTVTYEAWR